MGGYPICAAGTHQLHQHISRVTPAGEQAPAALPQFGIEGLETLEHEGHPSNGSFRVKQQIAIQHKQRQNGAAATSCAQGRMVVQAQIAPEPHHRAPHTVSPFWRNLWTVWWQYLRRGAIMQLLHN